MTIQLLRQAKDEWCEAYMDTPDGCVWPITAGYRALCHYPCRGMSANTDMTSKAVMS